VPLESGAVDSDYRVAFDEIVLPVLRQILTRSAAGVGGFDAHERDPLATMRLTSEAFGAMTMGLRQVAEDVCRGRMALVTEGDTTAGCWPRRSTRPSRALARRSPSPVWPAVAVRRRRRADARLSSASSRRSRRSGR
jgi:acetoin utilization deacetylase AcuC-like enzyme